MEQELNKLQHIMKVAPSEDLGDKIWSEILRRKVETISWYKVAVAACFLGVLLLSSIYVSQSSRKDRNSSLADGYQMTNSYDLYNE